MTNTEFQVDDLAILTPEEEQRLFLIKIKKKLEKRNITFPRRTSLTDVEIVESITKRWDNVLRRLAQIDD